MPRHSPFIGLMATPLPSVARLARPRPQQTRILATSTCQAPDATTCKCRIALSKTPSVKLMRATASETIGPAAPARQGPQRMRRRTAFALSCLAAAVLNIAAICIVTGVVTQWDANPAMPRTSWVTTVYVVPPRPLPSAQEPHAALATQKLDPGTDRARRAPAPRTHLLATPSEAVLPIRYYRFGEVDRPAMPDSDWNLDTATLDAAGLNRLVFEIFVSSSGEVIACTILQPGALTSHTRRALEDRLRHTTLQPARRDGRAVASVRRIELTVLPSE